MVLEGLIRPDAEADYQTACAGLRLRNEINCDGMIWPESNAQYVRPDQDYTVRTAYIHDIQG